MLYRCMVLLALLVLPATALAQNSPQLHWERYDNIVEIRADGSVQVREQQELVVDSGPARGMTRVFETGDQGRLTNIQVLEDGQPLTRRGDISTRDPGTFAGGDNGTEAQIRVNFRDPNADRHSITIQYVINRTLVAANNRATLDWNFFWRTSDAPEIRNGSVRISFPGAVSTTQLDARASGLPVRQSSTSNSVFWELTQPIQGRALNVSASFPQTLLAETAQLRPSGTTRPAVPNNPSNPTIDPVPGAAIGLGIGGMVFCLFILFFLFIAFMIIRASARAMRGRGFSGPGYDQGGPFGSPYGSYGPRRRRRYGGWGGGFFPPVIITPPHQQHGPYDNSPSPYDNTPLDGGMGGGSSSWNDSGGGSSSWNDSGGSSSSWNDSGGSSSSWGDMGGGGSSWGGGGDSGGGGGGGGGSFD